jgi:hypothetical protein
MDMRLKVFSETIHPQEYTITTWTTSDGEIFYSESEATDYQNYIDALERIEQLPCYNGYTLLRTQSDINDWRTTFPNTEFSIEVGINPPIWVGYMIGMKVSIIEYDIVDDMFIKSFADKMK